MKHITRKILLFLILSMPCLFLGGCIKTFDCSGYIQGMLDATYKGEFENYAKMTRSDPAVIEENYNRFIDHETQIMLYFCGMTVNDNVPDELSDRLKVIIQNIYKQARYTVHEADRSGRVDIQIEPIDLYNSIYEEFLDFNTRFKERNNNYEFKDYTEEEFTRAYLEPLISILDRHQDKISFQEPVTITVIIAPDDDGRYTISNEEVTQIYNTVINYTLDNAH